MGQPRDRLIGREVFPETAERLARFKGAFELALEGEANSVERERYDLPAPDGGRQEVWWNTHQQPVRATDGAVVGVLQHVVDVTAEVRAERMRDVVLRELDHRMKNQLANISAIARRTAKDAEDTDAFLENFDRRLQAMSRTHQMLVDGQWSGLSMADLVISELSPYRDGVDVRIVVEGPPVTLSPAEFRALGLALHELATNAAKYGALGDDGVSLLIDWTEHSDAVRLNWTETGLKPVVPPSRQGFGSIIVD